MSLELDNLLKERRFTDAVRYLAKELYKSGKTGYTRKMVLDELAERVDRYEKWESIKVKPKIKGKHYLVISKLNLAHGGTLEDNQGDIKRNMKVAYYDITGQFNEPHVTHWRHLPAGPKEEDRSGDK